MNPVDNLGSFAERQFVCSPSLLEHLYWEEQLTICEIAKRLGSTYTTVHRRMEEYGIIRRDTRYQDGDERISGENNPNFGGLSERTKRKLSKIHTLPKYIRISVQNLPDDTWKEKNGNWKGGLTYHTCEVCGEDFRSNKGNARFCSKACKNIAHSKFMKNQWKTNERMRKRVLKNLVKAKEKPTSIEREVGEILSANHFGFRYVGDGRLWIGYPPLNPDFIHKTFDKVLEVFGNYWHNSEEEKARIDAFSKFGYDALVIWEHELNNHEKVIEKLRNWLGIKEDN